MKNIINNFVLVLWNAVSLQILGFSLGCENKNLKRFGKRTHVRVHMVMVYIYTLNSADPLSLVSLSPSLIKNGGNVISLIRSFA